MLTLQVNYKIDKSVQIAALKNGKSLSSKQTVQLFDVAVPEKVLNSDFCNIINHPREVAGAAELEYTDGGFSNLIETIDDVLEFIDFIKAEQRRKIDEKVKSVLKSGFYSNVSNYEPQDFGYRIFTDLKPEFAEHPRAAELKAAIEKENAATAKKLEQRKKEKAAKKAAEEKYEAEKNEWIKKHGSERLKTMLAEGYEHRLTYEQERVEKEYPDYEVDWDNSFDWNDRANPSLEAMKLAKKLSGEVKWITDDGDEEFDFDPYEAIVFRPDWIRKDVIAVP